MTPPYQLCCFLVKFAKFLRTPVLKNIYKYILARKLFFAIMYQVWIFFIWRKNVSFSKYLDFCVIDKCTNFKLFNFVMEVTAHYMWHFKLFLWNPREHWVKIGQLIVHPMTYICNSFLALLWRLENDFHEMAL